MSKVNSVLLNHSPLSISVWAIRKCYDSLKYSDTFIDGTYFNTDNIGEKDAELMFGKIMDSRHYSTLEHITYTFDSCFSRAVLQEWSRHRIKSQSTKSTRYTLSKFKNRLKKLSEPVFEMYMNNVQFDYSDELKELIQYISENLSDSMDPMIKESQIKYLISLKNKAHLTNDQFKYALPESWMTSSVDTFNVRALRNLFELRTSPRAHFEIRDLANIMLEQIPESHRPFFKEFYL